MQKKIIIFGTGEGARIVGECLSKNTIISAYIDNNDERVGTVFNDIMVEPVSNLFTMNYDYLILSMFYNYDKVMEQLAQMKLNNEKSIVFFDKDNIANSVIKKDIFVDNVFYKAMYYKNNKDSEQLENLWEKRYKNLKYEIADNKEKIENPKVMTIEQSIREIIDKQLSVSRFGDGEFEIMRGNRRPIFQLPNKDLAKRLRDVINKKEEGFAVAIADNYGRLEQYTQDAADSIRLYLDEKTREYHMKNLDKSRFYLNAYLSRPYIIFNSKDNAKERFLLLKQIWENREIVIVEGDKTRMGVGNKLFDNAKVVQRIIASNENAYDNYEKILRACQKCRKEQLFLIALGPTATVLAYDLFSFGFQAIDIGHLDNEYEWYKAKVIKRTKIQDKYVGEVFGGTNILGVQEKTIEGIISIVI